MTTHPHLQFFLSPEAKSQNCMFTPPRLGDAGFDIRSIKEVVIPSGGQDVIPTGLHLSVPLGYVAIIKDRSSMALKRICTSGGVIDASYRGEVKVIVSNNSKEDYSIKVGDKIAQMIVIAHADAAIEVQSLEELGETERGTGGFGSTGK